MRKRYLAVFGALTVVLATAVPASSSGPTTTEQTILDTNADNRLDLGAGDDYLVRQTLSEAKGDRADRRKRLISFGQLTDIHVVDEESPARAESADGLIPPAYRPQESLESQVAAAMVNRLNGIVSPIDGQPMDDFVVTGDSTDNIQLNENRDFIDVLNGAQVNPDSGDPNDPDNVCDTAIPGGAAPRYDGIRGGKDVDVGLFGKGGYYNPDSSNAGDDGDGYSPNEADNQAAVGRAVAERDFLGLFEAAQLPFDSPGLGAPWYSVFGNHDSLILGTLIGPAEPNYMYEEDLFRLLVKLFGKGNWANFDTVNNDLAVGCHKWLPGDDITLPFLPPDKWWFNPSGAEWSVVPPDPERRMIDQQEWIDEHLNAASNTPDTNTPDGGHGFGDRPSADATYYSTSPKAGIRYIGLDTTNHVFLEGGVVYDEEFNWLKGELEKAKDAGEVVMVFGHHTLRTMNNGFDLPGSTETYHFGLEGEKGMALRAIPDAQIGESLEELFLQYPNVISYVAGHEHENYIGGYRDSEAPGSFWEIATAAHIDWPSQSRLIDVFDNCDGTISIFGTLVDQAGATDPGNPDLSFPLGKSDPLILASIARELGYNDYQGDNGDDGDTNARGPAKYRNVELLVTNPVAQAAACSEQDGGDGGTTTTTTGGGSEQQAAGTQEEELVFDLSAKSLKANKTKRLSKKSLAKLIRKGFKGKVDNPAEIEKLKASLVMKRGKRCYRIDKLSRRKSCNATTTRGLKTKAKSSRLRFTYRPLASGKKARHSKSARRILKKMLKGKILRKGTYNLSFKVFPNVGEPKTYTFKLKVR